MWLAIHALISGNVLVKEGTVGKFIETLWLFCCWGIYRGAQIIVSHIFIEINLAARKHLIMSQNGTNCKFDIKK